MDEEIRCTDDETVARDVQRLCTVTEDAIGNIDSWDWKSTSSKEKGVLEWSVDRSWTWMLCVCMCS
jgi:hypothetical protein